MAWLLLLLVLLAAAFGILGAVVKATAFLVLTILLTVAVLGAVAWHGVKARMRRWQHEAAGDGGSQLWTRASGRSHRDLPPQDDRY